MIVFDHNHPSNNNYYSQARNEVEARLERWGGKGLVPFMGKYEGFVVNYGPNRAVYYDRKGVYLKTEYKAYKPGEVQAFLK